MAFDLLSFLLGKSTGSGGGGGSASLGPKTIRQNGVYRASSDNLDGYNTVTVEVPNTYAAADEGKVVSNGALIAQTSRNITANGTYDTTLNDEVVVNVSGGSSSVTVSNIIDPTGVTYVTGYLATNGSISAAGGITKEVTTGFIDISAFQGKTIQAWLTVANRVLPWAGVAYYTDAESIIGSREIAIESWTSNTYAANAAFTAMRVIKNDNALGIGAQLTVPSNAKYIRISFRTGSNGALVLTDDMSTSQDFVDGNIVSVTFANALISNGTDS